MKSFKEKERLDKLSIKLKREEMMSGEIKDEGAYFTKPSENPLEISSNIPVETLRCGIQGDSMVSITDDQTFPIYNLTIDNENE